VCVVPWVAFRRVVRPMAIDYSCLRDAVVLITGCDHGFGRALALRFHALGAVVYAGLLSDKAKARDSLVREAGEEPGNPSNRMRGITLDVSKDSHVKAALQEVQNSGLPLRALINNAGISAFGWAEELPFERYQKNMEVNFFGTVRVTKAFLPLIRRSKGRIVSMGSIGARMPSAFGSAYLPTKAAMVSYSECLRQELYRFGVRVCVVEPGFFSTKLLETGGDNGATESVAGSIYPSYKEKMNETKKMVEIFEKINGGADGVEKVVNCCVDAVCNRLPLTRYVVGWDAMLFRHLLCFAPNWAVDWVQTYMDSSLNKL